MQHSNADEASQVLKIQEFIFWNIQAGKGSLLLQDFIETSTQHYMQDSSS